MASVRSIAIKLECSLTEVSHWMSSNRPKLNADKTELLWAGSMHVCPFMGNCGPTLQLGADTVSVFPGNDVRVLGVTVPSDLSMDKHVSRLLNWCGGHWTLRVSSDSRSYLCQVPHGLL